MSCREWVLEIDYSLATTANSFPKRTGYHSLLLLRRVWSHVFPTMWSGAVKLPLTRSKFCFPRVSAPPKLMAWGLQWGEKENYPWNLSVKALKFQLALWAGIPTGNGCWGRGQEAVSGEEHWRVWILVSGGLDFKSQPCHLLTRGLWYICLASLNPHSSHM